MEPCACGVGGGKHLRRDRSKGCTMADYAPKKGKGNKRKTSNVSTNGDADATNTSNVTTVADGGAGVGIGMRSLVISNSGEIDAATISQLTKFFEGDGGPTSSATLKSSLVTETNTESVAPCDAASEGGYPLGGPGGETSAKTAITKVGAGKVFINRFPSMAKSPSLGLVKSYVKTTEARLACNSATKDALPGDYLDCREGPSPSPGHVAPILEKYEFKNIGALWADDRVGGESLIPASWATITSPQEAIAFYNKFYYWDISSTAVHAFVLDKTAADAAKEAALAQDRADARAIQERHDWLKARAGDECTRGFRCIDQYKRSCAEQL